MILDRAFQFGDGIFESMRCIDGRVVGLRDHIQRLLSSARSLRLPMKENAAQIKKYISDAVRKTKGRDLYIKLILSRGIWLGSVLPDQDLKPSFIIISKPFVPFSESFYQRGLKVCLINIRRNETSPLSSIKSLNYLDNIMGRVFARQKGFHEGLFLNTKGYVAEGTMSNIFCVRHHQLITPPISDGVLPGITRKWILGHAGSVGLEVHERSMRPRDLTKSAEVFLSNSLMGIVPVTRIDHHLINSDKTGTYTGQLQQLYDRAGKRSMAIG
ncbi:MAG: aminotransferase class IV [Chlamydiota bacterium]|nr:aminotransferase class IV [Chlamydiota bacterium]